MPVDKEAAGIRDAVAPAAKSINTTPATPDDSAQPQQMSNVGRTFIIAAIALAIFIGSLVGPSHRSRLRMQPMPDL